MLHELLVLVHHFLGVDTVEIRKMDRPFEEHS